MRVALGIPTRTDTWPIYFALDVMALVKPVDTLIIHEVGKPVDIARNDIVQRFLDNEDATHLFFMDADMRFPASTLVALTRCNLDIVSGLYFSRDKVPVPHGYRFVRSDGNVDRFYPEGEALTKFLKNHWEEHSEASDISILPAWDDRLFPVDALGGGCLLLSRKVLEDVGFPWFESYQDTGGGEDFNFCTKARALGYQPYINWSIRCGHELPRQFQTVEDFVSFFEVNQETEHDWSLPAIEVRITRGGWARRAGSAILSKVAPKL